MITFLRVLVLVFVLIVILLLLSDLLLFLVKPVVDLPRHFVLGVVENEVGLSDRSFHPADPLEMPPVVNMVLFVSYEGVLVVHKLLKLLLVSVVVIISLKLNVLVLNVLMLYNPLLDLLPVVLFGVSLLDLPFLLFLGLFDDGLFDKLKMVVYDISNRHDPFFL